jgi:hypothetical protein
MTWTAAEESRIQALENDVAQLIEKVELNMVTKTEFHAKTLLLEAAIQRLEQIITSGDPPIEDPVLKNLYGQLTTLRDAYLGHTTHPPPTI